jgi:hypothetical protein
MELDHPDLWATWQCADEVDTHRVIVLGTGPGGISPQRALAAFREMYPGKKDTIELAISKDWTKEKFTPTCERIAFPKGELSKFWPLLMKPQFHLFQPMPVKRLFLLLFQLLFFQPLSFSFFLKFLLNACLYCSFIEVVNLYLPFAMSMFSLSP